MYRTDEKEEKEFLNAAAAIYAWISCADGEVSILEYDCFVKDLNDLPFVKSITSQDFSEAYLTLLESFKSDFEDGKARAQIRIESFAGDEERSLQLLQMAIAAMEADYKIEKEELKALREIEELLGMNKKVVK